MEYQERVHLTVTLPTNSVMIPAWLMACFVACFLLATVSLLAVWNTNAKLVGEIRVLQIYQEDVESVLIRNGIATRSDFIPHSTIPLPAQKEK